MEDVKKAYGLSGEVEVMFERRMRYKSLFEKDFFSLTICYLLIWMEWAQTLDVHNPNLVFCSVYVFLDNFFWSEN